MGEIAVENINIAEIMSAEGAAENVEKVKVALEADPEMGPMLRGAQTVEDVYHIVKRFSKATFEQVKVILKKTMEYYRRAKAELSDEVLENVSGGWSFSAWWKEAKSVIVSSTIMVSCIVAGAVVGACVGGVGGAIAGAAVGAMAGGVIAYTTATIMDAVNKKK